MMAMLRIPELKSVFSFLKARGIPSRPYYHFTMSKALGGTDQLFARMAAFVYTVGTFT
jgi:hypothetical protein